MMLKFTKWFEDNIPKELDVRSQLESEGFSVAVRTEQPGGIEEPIPSTYLKSIVVIKGMARITLPNLQEDFMDIMAGDRLDIPMGTIHGIMIGPAGAIIIEGKK